MSGEPTGLSRSWLLVSNAAMMIGWAKVLKLLFRNWRSVHDPLSPVGLDLLTPAVVQALSISFLEVFNSLVGVTRSKPLQVLLFAVVRFGVQVIVAPLLPCTAWQHLLTVFCWSLGDTIRFACFVLDNLVPKGHIAKAVRYTVGPMVFPFGATGEMLMVLAVARNDRPLFYLAALLWPAGFYPLFVQLLAQRRKFFESWKQEALEKQRHSKQI
jgi:hypothetical protein